MNDTDVLADETAFDIESLDEQQQLRLTHVLDEYLQALEEGDSFDVDDACAGEPELRKAVAVYLSKLNSLYGLSTSLDEQPKEVPKQLGEFTLVRQIGRGGMGVVYLATQAGVERRVALKLLPLAATLDERQIARFKNESRAAGGIQHPNIVPVFSVGMVDGVHYYAMQYVDGVSVDRWIEDQRDADQQASWCDVVRWAIAALQGLDEAHESGVVHRDIKPSNLMIDREGKIWITDFGLARIQDDRSLTRSGDVVGTMRYMSPEQARGQSGLVDGRSDTYALAVTLYEMLTSQPVYAGDDAATILKSIGQENVPLVRQIRPDLPRDLETVIAKAMSAGRDDRYATAGEFANDLQHVLSGEPTIARPPTLVDRLTRVTARHQRAVLVSVLVMLLGVVGFAISTAKISAYAARKEASEKLARRAVDRLGSQTSELLADIPSAANVRRQLLRQTLDYYKRFAATAVGNTELRRDLAITYGKIGAIQRELGETQNAIPSLESCERLHRELASSANPSNEARLEWSISKNNLAESLQASGQLEEAAREFAQTLKIQQALAKDSRLRNVNAHLATTLNNLALLLAESDASAEAETYYLQAIAVLEDSVLVAAKSTDGQAVTQEQLPALLQLAKVRCNLSGLLAESAPERAIEQARSALALQTDALENDLGNAKLATQVVVTLNSLGAAQSNGSQPSLALASFDRAVEISRQLLLRWPDQPNYQRDLVISLNQRGRSLSGLGKLEEAKMAFEEALTYQRPLAEQFPEDAETHSMLGGLLNNLGFLQQRLGETGQAVKSFTEASEHQSQAVTLAPQVDRYQSYLNQHRQNLAEARQAI